MLDGEHVERGFRSAISQQFNRGVLPSRVGLLAYAAQFARDIDDLRFFDTLKKRQHGLTDRNDANIIDSRQWLEHIAVDLAGWAIVLALDACVEDEKVQVSEPANWSR